MDTIVSENRITVLIDTEFITYATQYQLKISTFLQFFCSLLVHNNKHIDNNKHNNNNKQNNNKHNNNTVSTSRFRIH